MPDRQPDREVRREAQGPRPERQAGASLGPRAKGLRRSLLRQHRFKDFVVQRHLPGSSRPAGSRSRSVVEIGLKEARERRRSCFWAMALPIAIRN